MLFGREPVAWYGVAITATFVLTEFGVELSQSQQTASLGLVAAVLGLVTRSKVTPWQPGQPTGAQFTAGVTK